MNYHDYLYASGLYRTEGETGLKNLERIAECLGYSSIGVKNGDPISRFLADNPGAIEAIHEWIANNMTEEWIESLSMGDPEVEDEETT